MATSLDRTADGKYLDALYTKMESTPRWMNNAACTQPKYDQFEQPEEFIAEHCDHCPVKKQCGEYAHTRDITLGVFGGEQYPR